MSSEIAFTSNAYHGYPNEYDYGSDILIDEGDAFIFSVSLTATANNSWVTMNNTGKNKLFPNSTAHPVKADIQFYGLKFGLSSTNEVRFYVGGTQIFNQNVKDGTYTFNNRTDSAIKNSVKSTEIKWVITHGSITGTGIGSVIVRYYFNRYDFSAVADTGVTSASVSSSTGYGGAGITFSCVIPTGYVFDGWYKAGAQTPYSTAQSFTYTIPTDNAANYDLSLTAKAHQDTHSVNGTYNGSTKAILTGVTGDVTVSYNGKTKTMPTDGTEFTLGETGKAMHTDIVVGSTSLHCAELLMRSPLVLEYTGYTPPLMRLLNLNRIISTSVTTDSNYAVTNFQRSYGTTDGQIQNITYTQNSLTFNEGCNAGKGTCFPLTLAVGRSYRLKWTASGETDTARIYLTGYTNGVYDSGMFGTSGSINNHIGAQTYDFTVPSGATTVCITFGAQTGKMVSYTGVELIEL